LSFLRSRAEANTRHPASWKARARADPRLPFEQPVIRIDLFHVIAKELYGRIWGWSNRSSGIDQRGFVKSLIFCNNIWAKVLRFLRLTTPFYDILSRKDSYADRAIVFGTVDPPLFNGASPAQTNHGVLVGGFIASPFIAFKH
jgi:hypothetical protein